jgi:hypothetical protein
MQIFLIVLDIACAAGAIALIAWQVALEADRAERMRKEFWLEAKKAIERQEAFNARMRRAR